jgi:hypothetical protein
MSVVVRPTDIDSADATRMEQLGYKQQLMVIIAIGAVYFLVARPARRIPASRRGAAVTVPADA